MPPNLVDFLHGGLLLARGRDQRLVKQVARALRFDSRKCILQLQDFLEVPFLCAPYSILTITFVPLCQICDVMHSLPYQVFMEFKKPSASPSLHIVVDIRKKI